MGNVIKGIHLRKNKGNELHHRVYWKDQKNEFKKPIALITAPLPFFEAEKKILKDFVKVRVAKGLTEKELVLQVEDVEALLVTLSYPKITPDIIDAAKKLKVVSRYGVGLDNIDLEAATNRGIYVTYVPDYHIPTVAEHILALSFALARKIVQANESVKSGHWMYSLFEGVDIEGKTFGIIGFGRIGKSLAKKATALGMKVLAYDPYVREDVVREHEALWVSLKTLLRKSDFVSINVPLTDETKGMIGKKEFNEMKETAYLINTSRGPVVNEKDLYRALKEGKIAGAGLDVLEKEPPDPNNPLFELNNVIVTPHIGAYTKEAMMRLEMTAVQNVISVFKGEVPKYLANIEILKRNKEVKSKLETS